MLTAMLTAASPHVILSKIRACKASGAVVGGCQGIPRMRRNKKSSSSSPRTVHADGITRRSHVPDAHPDATPPRIRDIDARRERAVLRAAPLAHQSRRAAYIRPHRKLAAPLDTGSIHARTHTHTHRKPCARPQPPRDHTLQSPRAKSACYPRSPTRGPKESYPHAGPTCQTAPLSRPHRFRRSRTLAMCLIIEGRFSGTHSRGSWSSRHSVSAGAMSRRERRSVSMCSKTFDFLLCVLPE